MPSLDRRCRLRQGRFHNDGCAFHLGRVGEIAAAFDHDMAFNAFVETALGPRAGAIDVDTEHTFNPA